jgi:hypothetical protein
MTAIAYRKTRFTPPEKIPEASFLHYKKLLQQDPDIPLTTETQRFTLHFRRTLKNLSWMAPLCLLLIATFFMLFPDRTTGPDPKRIVLFVIILIFCAMTLGLLLHVLLEGPSYATFLKDRAAYFYQMKIDIIKSPDHASFCNRFYSPDRKPLSVPAPRLARSIDLFLTDLFHFLDRYLWIYGLLAAIIFFARKVLMKS